MSGLSHNKSFRALFVSQFLGAFNDNLYKNAMVMLITFELSRVAEQTGLLITLAAGLFILPFFLFSSIAGQMADRYAKTRLIHYVNFSEFIVMLFGAFALMQQHLVLLFITLFFMGTQSTFFGPLKYSILPEIVDSKSLMRGNALFSGSTFIAILLGTILGGMGVMMPGGTTVMAFSVALVALLGFLVSLLMQPSQPQAPDLTIEKNIFVGTWRNIQLSQHYPRALFSILTISWFWLLGSVLLSQIPTLVKYDLLADESVVIAFMSLFSIGIAVGGYWVQWWQKGECRLGSGVLWLVLISFCLLCLVWVVSSLSLSDHQEAQVLMPLSEFAQTFPQNMTLLLLFLLSAFGGAYIVPLYTKLQTETPNALRARMIALNNISNALFMVLASVALMLGFAMGASLLNMLAVIAVLNGVIAYGYFQGKKRISLE